MKYKTYTLDELKNIIPNLDLYIEENKEKWVVECIDDVLDIIETNINNIDSNYTLFNYQLMPNSISGRIIFTFKIN